MPGAFKSQRTAKKDNTALPSSLLELRIITANGLSDPDAVCATALASGAALVVVWRTKYFFGAVQSVS